MSALEGKAVWIVGASSGIGAALADELVTRGARVAVSARRADRLESVAGDRMSAVPLDVTDRKAVDEAADRVAGLIGGPDLVVFSAGAWEQMDAAAWDRDRFARQIEVNLLGLNNVVGAVLPSMLQRGGGGIVGLASVAGYRGLAGAEAYGATKAAQINLLEALRIAVGGRGVDVITVCPGFVRTELTEANSFPMPFMIEADQAARSICDGLEQGRAEIVFPLPMAIMMKIARLLPVRLWATAMQQFTRPKGR